MQAHLARWNTSCFWPFKNLLAQLTKCLCSPYCGCSKLETASNVCNKKEKKRLFKTYSSSDTIVQTQLIQLGAGVQWIQVSFYTNVTTLRSGICRRNSVCRRLSVTFVYATQPVEIFGNVSTPFCSLAIRWPLCKILRRSSQGPSVGG